MNRTLSAPYWALRVTYGAVPVVAGLDKFTNLLVDWSQYLAPSARALLPVGPETFMGVVGVVEVLVGLAVLTKLTRVGAYVAMAWLTLVALQLVAAGQLDVAVRDLAMAVGAFALARLEEARSGGPGVEEPSPALASAAG